MTAAAQAAPSTPAAPATPAATVALLRDAAAGPEVLMLRKNAGIHFGGMWVFPGGRIESGDAPRDAENATPADAAPGETAARNAAAREAREEAGIELAAAQFAWFSHWMPPGDSPVRFATWFFAARADAQAITVDGREITAHQWLQPRQALIRHDAGELDLAPPTWVTLHQLSGHRCVDALLANLRARPARHYATRLAQRRDGVRVALWAGDAGYATADADAPGARHRLAMAPGGFVFEDDAGDG